MRRCCRSRQDPLLVESGRTGRGAGIACRTAAPHGAGALAPVREIVPAERTVLLYGVRDVPRFQAELLALVRTPAATDSGELVEIPVRYDGADLGAVAELWG